MRMILRSRETCFPARYGNVLDEFEDGAEAESQIVRLADNAHASTA